MVSANEQEIAKLKEQIEELRESRTKMRSHNSSLSSSITIYPSADSSPVGDREEGEGPEEEPEEGKEATPDPEQEEEGKEATPDPEEGKDPEQKIKEEETECARKSPEVSESETGQGTPE